MPVVAILALDGALPFELSIPGQVFGTANDVVGGPYYDLRTCARGGRVTTAGAYGGLRIATDFDVDALADADTVVVPGHAGFLDRPDPVVVAALRSAADAGARLASVCVGAFTLAATGLLDGYPATTHWQYTGELARRHPAVRVDGDNLYIDNGALITSAGVAAGLDLCLHLVRRDVGATVAAATARRVVMPPQRAGGQSQFIEHPDPERTPSALQATLCWMEARLHEPLTLGEIARYARMSVRGLNRHFRAQTGTTPLQWLLRARVQRARLLLESTALPVEQVAAEAGFGSAASLRVHFARQTGVSPQEYRGAFRFPSEEVTARRGSAPALH
ncbi:MULTISPECIES: GlxA family transcriptional regulator [Streptomyces]|uniref:GlxA family transcriptional regulator n=1 Tax=Streptomyces TaxID=1883 RepID=UPI002249255C|nr:helix-turn-helix domain-containing protein [Streptomyces sp. JHD 1]MCX2968311.1 helix-turn-helix domain-containing protein [Streptomyces sp. JHD 1]